MSVPESVIAQAIGESDATYIARLEKTVTELEPMAKSYAALESDVLKLTATWDEHPDWWEQACDCASCRSYADPSDGMEFGENGWAAKP